MKTSPSTATGAILCLLTPVFLQCSGHSDLPKPTSTAKKYNLALTCVANTIEWSPSKPYITLNLTNPSAHTLFFPFAPGMDPNFVVFSVEYKAAADNPNLSTGWLRLQPNYEPPYKFPFPGLVLEEVTDKQSIAIPSHQTGQLTFPPDFVMSKNGFYRISAVLTVPVASEYQGAVPGSTKFGSFKLVARSKPFIIRRTDDGFIAVDISTNKKSVPVPK